MFDQFVSNPARVGFVRRLIRKFRLRGIEFPVYEVTRPAALAGVDNGRVPPSLLGYWPLAQGGTGRTLIGAPLRSWVALQWLARLYQAALLTATSPGDTYRDYDHQVAGFKARMTTVPLPGRPTRVWQRVTYWLKPGMAGIAVPGTSNHGWGLAVDHGILVGSNIVRPAAWLAWFIPTVDAAGWSWESSTEDWHVRYCAGDVVTDLVQRVEQARAVRLATGASGDTVKLLQTKLGGLSADGNFGPRTEARVRQWQTQQTSWYGGEGLPVDGVVDGDDWFVLFGASS